jgi:hypothetical protein
VATVVRRPDPKRMQKRIAPKKNGGGHERTSVDVGYKSLAHVCIKSSRLRTTYTRRIEKN